ncbi:MAG TPA: G1 family glutamic endopeptidase, partial [Acidimicrobiales bacterium]|nr:G1 family glutamic endopeptidase [Acidimicrobiales bacterium]
MPSRRLSLKVRRAVAGVVVCVGATATLSGATASASGAPHPVSASPGPDGLRATSSAAAWAGRMKRVAHSHALPRLSAVRSTKLGPSPARWLHAPTRRTATGAGTRNGLESGNWSGMIASGITFNGVFGQWVVPTVASSSANEYSGTWVGIDGATNSSLIQTGTSQDSGGGTTSYNAWYEILPSAEIVLPDAVSPGDTMEAEVVYSGGTWNIAIEDVTKQWLESGPVSYSGPGATAEWIEEAPTVGGNLATLANFGTMQFSNIAISGSASSAALVPVAMANSHGVVIAYPGAYDGATGSFPITFGTPAPAISSVSPAQGPTVGGTSIVVNGDYLTGATSVSVGGTTVPSTVNPDNSLTVTAPAEPVGTVDVTVTTPGGTSTHVAADQFTYILTAQVITFTSTSPSAATVGGTGYNVSATGGGSGIPVTFAIDPSASSVCSITGATVSFNGVGTCVIDANQVGNATYSAAPQAQQSFSVAHADAITSAAAATGKVGTPFMFTVTTAGAPVPSITKTGKLPKHVTLVNNGDGTAAISGTPTKAGTSHFTVKATFGTGKTKKIV